MTGLFLPSVVCAAFGLAVTSGEMWAPHHMLAGRAFQQQTR